MIVFIVILPLVLLYALLGIWVERKFAGFIQDRPGPEEVGFKGLLQTFADILKLIQKEEIYVTGVNKVFFMTAPVLIFVSVIVGFVCIPLGNNFIGADLATGAYFILAIISLDVYGFIMAGYASLNKFAVFGAIRSVAQMLSYEIPIGLIMLSVFMIAQSLSLSEIALQQGIHSNEVVYFLGIKALNLNVTEIGGFLSFNVFRFPLLWIGAIIFFIATLAEANRGPFDIPEAESELIAGFHTEYSGFRWSMMMLGEYTLMLLVAMLGVILFFGGWNTPLPNLSSKIEFLKFADLTSGDINGVSGVIWGIFWLMSKSIIWVLIQFWVRWTYPRLRVDQLMYLGWKVLTPASLVIVLFAGVWRLLMI